MLYQLCSAQSTNAKRLKAIDSEISQAVTTENYQKAAELKREKELRLKMSKALQEENYALAADIQQQLEEGGAGSANAELARLEKELQSAINNEEYAKASEIKKQMEALKTGGTYTPSATSTAETSASSTPATGEEPQFVNQVYFRATNGTLHSLEKEEGKLTTSGGGFYYAEATSSYMIPGAESPVRLDPNKLSFVVKALPGVDPSSQIKLVKLDVRGRHNNRYADAYKTTSAMFHSETGAVSENDIPIAFKSLGNNVFEIVLQQRLKPGEYAFMYITKMFAFGID